MVLPPDLRARLETARLNSLALFRALDRLDLRPPEIRKRLLHTLFELDADCAEALWALDQPPRTLNEAAMYRDTLTSLERLPLAQQSLRRKLPPTVHPRLQDLEAAIRATLDPREAYNVTIPISGKHPV